MSLSAGKLNCTAIICMPVNTPDIKVNNVRKLGGIVELVGETFQEAQVGHAGAGHVVCVCGGGGSWLATCGEVCVCGGGGWPCMVCLCECVFVVGGSYLAMCDGVLGAGHGCVQGRGAVCVCVCGAGVVGAGHVCVVGGGSIFQHFSPVPLPVPSPPQTHAVARAKQDGLAYIPPYDDPHVIAGQGSIADEILRQIGDPATLDAIFVPVGGGGLVAGIAVYIKALLPHIKVCVCVCGGGGGGAGQVVSMVGEAAGCGGPRTGGECVSASPHSAF